ncbi:MAG: hypothetical protein HN560_02800 [Anaerolineae bacterium]|nr:hypothetical protein [Anaerolineae bacterium]MBT7599983.1 hypothetical protein [Anaerolineae bacterium]
MIYSLTRGINLIALSFPIVPWLVFSRLRQAHTNKVMFAWLSSGIDGLVVL